MRASVGLAGGAVLVGLFASSCGGGSEPLSVSWTEAQAASIAQVRGTPVRVHQCDGVGEAQKVDGELRYSRFECVAGTRLAGQSVDTVAVTYVLRPLEPYDGSASRHATTDVHFIGIGVP